MTAQPIIESGMTFGPYPDDQYFYIEKSSTYTSIQQGVKMAEFLLLRAKNDKPPVLWVVEAKSSTPHPKTKPGFDEFIAEIREKWVNAFSLGWASCLKRHRLAGTELPDPFKQLDLSKTGVHFVLVIEGHPEEWLPPLQDALKNALHSTVKTWGFGATPIAVINDEIAKQRGLISP